MRTFLAVTALGCLVLTLGALPASAGEKPQTFSLQELAERAQAGDRGARAMATETNPQGQVVLRTEFQPVDFGGRMVILNNTGATIGLFSSDSFSEGAWFLNDRFGNVRVGGLVTAESSGFLAVADSGGNTTYAMDGIQGFVSVGGDVAERFPAAGPVPPGSVLVIDPDRPGALRILGRGVRPACRRSGVRCERLQARHDTSGRRGRRKRRSRDAHRNRLLPCE